MLLSPLLTFFVLVIGALIGGVGIGGVLLLPALKYLGGFSLHQVIPACMLSYLFTGVVGAFIYARHGSINWTLAASVCLGALPGAYLGSFLLPHVSPLVLETVIGALILVAGMDALRGRQIEIRGDNQHAGAEYLLIGFVTGVGSALSGTGGPLLLIPILIWRKVSVLTAIGLAQAIMIPISVTATLGNFLHGEIDFKLGILLGVVLGVGSLLGAKSAHLLPVGLLKKVVAGLLVVVGIMILYRLYFI